MPKRGSRRPGYKIGKRWIGWHATHSEQKAELRLFERQERQYAKVEALKAQEEEEDRE